MCVCYQAEISLTWKDGLCITPSSHMADEKTSDSERPTQIGIHYQRSRHYRTIHADGAQIGVTPRGQIQFTLFSDQKAMPEFVLHQITPDGLLGNLVEQVVKEGVVREVEVNVIMDVSATASFVNVLQATLQQVEKLQKPQTVPSDESQETGK